MRLGRTGDGQAQLGKACEEAVNVKWAQREEKRIEGDSPREIGPKGFFIGVFSIILNVDEPVDSDIGEYDVEKSAGFVGTGEGEMRYWWY